MGRGRCPPRLQQTACRWRMSPTQPSWATWRRDLGSHGPQRPLGHRLHPPNPQGHPGAELTRCGRVEIGRSAPDPQPRPASPCAPGGVFPESPSEEGRQKEDSWTAGDTRARAESRRASTGPCPQRKPRRGLLEALEIIPRSLQRRRNGTARGDSGSVVLSVAIEGSRQTTRGPARPAAPGLRPPPVAAAQL